MASNLRGTFHGARDSVVTRELLGRGVSPALDEPGAHDADQTELRVLAPAVGDRSAQRDRSSGRIVDCTENAIHVPTVRRKRARSPR